MLAVLLAMFLCCVTGFTFLHLPVKLQVYFNPLPVQFKSLLPGQKGCVFFRGHLNLRTAPETGLPSREKIITIKLKKTE
jgi:hypothetical protein